MFQYQFLINVIRKFFPLAKPCTMMIGHVISTVDQPLYVTSSCQMGFRPLLFTQGLHPKCSHCHYIADQGTYGSNVEQTHHISKHISMLFNCQTQVEKTTLYDIIYSYLCNQFVIM